MQHTIDVSINVFGKPWQTLCTLKSLMQHCGDHIDKIYLNEEKCQPFGDDVSWILDYFNNVIHFKPKEFLGVASFHISPDSMRDEQIRYSYRYQYSIEKSDKKYLFITHNDILYKGDIVGNMLNQIGDAAGIGLIGQCWNCPAGRAGVCSGEKFNDYHPTYGDITQLMTSNPPARYDFYRWLDNNWVMPMPECRLNEFACLVNRETISRESYPNGDCPVFGGMEIMDTGIAWFREMCHRGHKFIHYDINAESAHGFWSPLPSEIRRYKRDSEFYVSGYPTQLNEIKYWEAEERAKSFYKENYE